MNLRDAIVDAIWEGFEAEDNACVDREMDLIDTGGTYETFSMKRVAEHVIEKLGLIQIYAPADVLHGGYIDANTQWEYDDYDSTKKHAGRCGQSVATRAVGRWVMVDEV